MSETLRIFSGIDNILNKKLDKVKLKINKELFNIWYE